MRLTLLLDLDDTLLDTNMDAFVPAYFQALAKHLKNYVQPDIMLPALMSGTQEMLMSRDSLRTLKQVFDADFYPKLGTSREQLSGPIDEFYESIFPTLQSVTKQRAGARELVDWAKAQGFHVAIATDPIFPRKASEHRIRWAGLDPQQFELISSYESFHFSKSYPDYYAEILGRLGWPDGPVLMAGNDVERDLLPAQMLGLPVYQVVATRQDSDGAERRGDLSQLLSWLQSVDLTSLEPDYKTPDAIRSILASTPGVLGSMSAGMVGEEWSQAPTEQDWSMTELVCHLRDTEREVHHMQIDILLNDAQPFVPRPDAAVWASQRDYRSENGPEALRAFGMARVETLDKLQDLGENVWARTARHAIFGPTNFTEVVGFMADHDRLHVQQTRDIIQSL